MTHEYQKRYNKIKKDYILTGRIVEKQYNVQGDK